jgi:twitching motility protein PilT
MPDYILDDLLRQMPELNASDLHLRVGEPPMFRIHGDLVRQDYPVLEDHDTKDLMYAKMTEAQVERLESFKELDMAYEVDGVARFRVNCFHQQRHLGAVMRMIPIKIKSIEELNLPQILKEFADLPRGLVLVTGPTGSGKSTTLAAMVNHINDTRKAHIITIEDPIEFVHEDRKCIVEQREVGQDTHAFADALKHVMRQTPDVILVGEMRDLETISLAITAAETGHLVFATLHTTDAMQTVDRMVDVFPPQQQQQIRMQLAVTLGGVICQSLLPIKGLPGRVASFEIMKASPAIRAVIREGKTHMIYNLIQSGAEDGMIVLDQYLAGLVRNNSVEYEQALAKSSYPNEFARRCGITESAAG